MKRFFQVGKARSGAPPNGNGGARRILVTGGDGYVGSHITRMLLERGDRVRVLSNFILDGGVNGIPSIPGVQPHERLEIMAGDVRNLRDVRKAVQGCDAVVALAAIVGDPACDLDSDETITTNYDAIPILIDACRNADVERVVYASTCAAYGASPNLILNEGSRQRTLSLYAETRLRAEEIVIAAKTGLTTVALRLATVFGLSPRMRFDLMVNTMTADAWRSGVVKVLGPDQWRPHLHGRDAARAFLLALDADPALVAGEVFNVGADRHNITIGGVAQLVAEEIPGTRVEVVSYEGKTRDYRVSFEKIRHVLGFDAEFDVRYGIREIYAALESGTLGDPRDPKYSRVEWLRRMWSDNAGLNVPGQRAVAYGV
jgi:nucleoside-diphosphate-sugar epimerase